MAVSYYMNLEVYMYDQKQNLSEWNSSIPQSLNSTLQIQPLLYSAIQVAVKWLFYSNRKYFYYYRPIHGNSVIIFILITYLYCTVLLLFLTPKALKYFNTGYISI